MSKRHLNRKVARAELEAVKQSLESMCYLLSSAPSAHTALKPTNEQFLMTDFQCLFISTNTTLFLDLSPGECKHSLAGLFLFSSPMH